MPARFKPMRNAAGFTLIELMVTVLIVGIISAFAVPGLSQFIRANRAAATAVDLSQSLWTARDAAIRSATPAVVCISTDGESCASSPLDSDGSAAWQRGWVSFVDINNDSALSAATTQTFGETVASGTTDLLVAYTTAKPDSIRIRFFMNGTASARANIRFLASGRADPVQSETLGSSAEAYFRIDPVADDGSPYCEARVSRIVTLTRTGRIQTTVDDCS